MGEYGADVIKVTGPGLSDVPFFQVDGNMGKRATEIDLKSAEGRKIFEHLLADVDIIVDGYRPGAIDKLGYGASSMAKMAEKRGKGIVYVNENCFGYVGEWADRPGWQQIADCVISPLFTIRQESCTKIRTGQRCRVVPRTIHGFERASCAALSYV